MADCVNLTDTTLESQNASLLEESSIQEFSNFIKDFALPGVCVFGVFGNILNLTILTRRKLQKSFRSLEQAANLCLIALAVSDLMFCVLAFLYTFIPADRVFHGQGLLYFYGMYSTTIINIFIMESTMLTVAMSLERYMAICFPLRQDLYLTTRRIKYIIVGSFIFSVVFNIPVLWRFEGNPICPTTNSVPHTTDYGNFSQTLASAHFKQDENPSKHWSGVSVVNNLSSKTQSSLSSPSSASIPSASSSHLSQAQPSTPSSISQFTKSFSSSASSSIPISSTSSPSPSPSYTRYNIQQVPIWGSQAWELAYRICWALVGNFIPLALLFYFNVCLCRNIYLSYRLRRQFKRQNQAKSSSHILTVTLVVIVVMFFILVSPSEIILLCGISGSLEIISNFLQSLNFSVNFILYCIISRHFRKTLKYLFLCGCYNIYQVSREWKKEFETSLM